MQFQKSSNQQLESNQSQPQSYNSTLVKNKIDELLIKNRATYEEQKSEAVPVILAKPQQFNIDMIPKDIKKKCEGNDEINLESILGGVTEFNRKTLNM